MRRPSERSGMLLTRMLGHVLAASSQFLFLAWTVSAASCGDVKPDVVEHGTLSAPTDFEMTGTVVRIVPDGSPVEIDWSTYEVSGEYGPWDEMVVHCGDERYTITSCKPGTGIPGVAGSDRACVDGVPYEVNGWDTGIAIGFGAGVTLIGGLDRGSAKNRLN